MADLSIPLPLPLRVRNLLVLFYDFPVPLNHPLPTSPFSVTTTIYLRTVGYQSLYCPSSVNPNPQGMATRMPEVVCATPLHSPPSARSTPAPFLFVYNRSQLPLITPLLSPSIAQSLPPKSIPATHPAVLPLFPSQKHPPLHLSRHVAPGSRARLHPQRQHCLDPPARLPRLAIARTLSLIRDIPTPHHIRNKKRVHHVILPTRQRTLETIPVIHCK